MPKKYTAVMVSYAGKKDTLQMSYLLVDEKYYTINVPGVQIFNGLKEGTIAVTNLGLSEDGSKLVFSNGRFEKYTKYNMATGKAETGAFVVLNRIEKEGELVGYHVYTPNGVIESVAVANAVALAKQGLIANGKLRETKSGKMLVTSIKGEYDVSVLDVEPKADASGESKLEGAIRINILYAGAFSIDSGSLVLPHYSIMIRCDSLRTQSAIVSKFVEDCRNKFRTLEDKVEDLIDTSSYEPILLQNGFQSMVVTREGFIKLLEMVRKSAREVKVEAEKNIPFSVIWYGLAEGTVEEYIGTYSQAASSIKVEPRSGASKSSKRFAVVEAFVKNEIATTLSTVIDKAQ